MSELKTASGDLVLEGNSLVLVTGADEVRQRVEQRLRMIRSEWFLDVTAGLPWFSDIFAKGQTRGVIEALIKNEIVRTPGVRELTAFELTIDKFTREARITAEIKGTDGDIGLLEVAI